MLQVNHHVVNKLKSNNESLQDLGYFDMDSCRLEPGPNPFGPIYKNWVNTNLPEGRLTNIMNSKGF